MFLTELQNQEVLDGYPVSFDCVVTGQPVPSVRWFKDGRVLEEDDHYMISEDQQGGHQLIITAVVPADMGVYRCLAENSAGVSSTKAELRVDRECHGQGLMAPGWAAWGLQPGGTVLGWRMVRRALVLARQELGPQCLVANGEFSGSPLGWGGSLVSLRGVQTGEEPSKVWRRPRAWWVVNVTVG